MQPDVNELRAFYDSPLGMAAQRSIDSALSVMLADTSGLEIAGLGYGTPFLNHFGSQAKRCISLMPAAQGAAVWPDAGANRVALVIDEQLPISDGCLDRLIAVHALEHAESPLEVLRECWRVLTPGGKLLLVTPNRRGLWARAERTPFGTGQPFSRGQLSGLLQQAMLSPVQWRLALAFPPVRRRSSIGLVARADRLMQRIAPAFSGVIVVEAEKRLYQGLPAAARQHRSVFVPVFMPAPTPRDANSHRAGA